MYGHIHINLTISLGQWSGNRGITPNGVKMNSWGWWAVELPGHSRACILFMCVPGCVSAVRPSIAPRDSMPSCLCNCLTYDVVVYYLWSVQGPDTVQCVRPLYNAFPCVMPLAPPPSLPAEECLAAGLGLVIKALRLSLRLSRYCN